MERDSQWDTFILERIYYLNYKEDTENDIFYFKFQLKNICGFALEFTFLF